MSVSQINSALLIIGLTDIRYEGGRSRPDIHDLTRSNQRLNHVLIGDSPCADDIITETMRLDDLDRSILRRANVRDRHLEAGSSLPTSLETPPIETPVTVTSFVLTSLRDRIYDISSWSAIVSPDRLSPQGRRKAAD